MSAGMTIIAIDGPAGSGKSTVARELAKRLNLAYLDTGAMYRAVTFGVLHNNIAPEDVDAVTELAARTEIDVADDGCVTVDGIDATKEIRGPHVTGTVSTIAAMPAVRENLVARQRTWADAHGGGVLEGRDIGTVVFPDATLKVYLTARPEVRAARRAGETVGADVGAIAAAMQARDHLDSTRSASPLTVAGDAVTVDTSDLSVEEIVTLIASALP